MADKGLGADLDGDVPSEVWDGAVGAEELLGHGRLLVRGARVRGWVRWVVPVAPQRPDVHLNQKKGEKKERKGKEKVKEKEKERKGKKK